MRQGRVLLNETFAGLITEDENGYRFEYDAEFLDSANAEPISKDFIEGMLSTGLDEIVAHRILDRFQKYQRAWNEIIEASFVTDEQKQQFRALIDQRLATLGRGRSS